MCRPRFRNPQPDEPDPAADFVRRVARDFQLEALAGDQQTLATVLGHDNKAADEESTALLLSALNSYDSSVAMLAEKMLARAADAYAEQELAKYDHAHETSWRAAA